jgi:hypothetical protein
MDDPKFLMTKTTIKNNKRRKKKERDIKSAINTYQFLSISDEMKM